MCTDDIWPRSTFELVHAHAGEVMEAIAATFSELKPSTSGPYLYGSEYSTAQLFFWRSWRGNELHLLAVLREPELDSTSSISACSLQFVSVPRTTRGQKGDAVYQTPALPELQEIGEALDAASRLIIRITQALQQQFGPSPIRTH